MYPECKAITELMDLEGVKSMSKVAHHYLRSDCKQTCRVLPDGPKRKALLSTGLLLLAVLLFFFLYNTVLIADRMFSINVKVYICSKQTKVAASVYQNCGLFFPTACHCRNSIVYTHPRNRPSSSLHL